MIEHIRTVGFKGFDLDEDIPQKVIYTGKNKSGKSTRAGAIALVIYGYIPFSTTGKKAGDILSSFGNDSLVVAIKINGKEFARKFSRNAKGSVSQIVQIDKKKVSSENFAIHLNRAGAPKIADTAEFMKQSEAKKIDTLFELFPNETLSGIDSEIEEAKEDVSKWNDKITGVKSTIQRLMESKTKIELPSGSIAEIQAEIKGIDSQVEDLEKQIKEAQLNQAKIEAREEGKKEEKKEAEKRTLEKMQNMKHQTAPQVEQNNSHAIINNGCPEVGDRFKSSKQVTDEVGSKSFPKFDNPISHPTDSRPYTDSEPSITNTLDRLNPSVSIKKIIEAMQSVGCGTCVALIVAKKELKKYKGVS